MKEISIGKFDVKLVQTTIPGNIVQAVEYCTLKAISKDQVYKKKKALLPHVGKRVEVFFRVAK